MEFLKHLKNKDDEQVVKILEKEYLKLGLGFDLPRINKHIKFKNGLRLSIQASSFHYCSPRKTLPYTEYEKMEVALMTNDSFVEIKDYLSTKEYEEYFDCGVYACVPVELIEKLFQNLKNKFGIKE